MTLTVGSLFSGIGGFDLGFERAGMEVKWQVEIDKQARSVSRRHFPEVEQHEDIRNCHSKEHLDATVRTWYHPLGSEYSDEEEINMGTLKKLTPDNAEECVRLYESGMSLGEIAPYFGVSRQSMWDLLRRRTVMRPQKKTGKDNHFFRGGSKADDAAQNMVEQAIKKGVLAKKDRCEKCGTVGTFKDGRSAIQAHHTDYNKPLDVMWLCQGCHHEWHKENTPKGKEENRELSAVDVICGGFP